MFDEVEIEDDFDMIPIKDTLDIYQTKDLDCDLSRYRITGARLLIKVEKIIHKPEKLFHTRNLTMVMNLRSDTKSMRLNIKNGVVVSAGLDNDFENNIYDCNPVWEEFL